jgi:hypothetical protein
LRSEFFNVANHLNFRPPDGNFCHPTFGQVLSAGNARFIQFGLKLLFLGWEALRGDKVTGKGRACISK